MDDAERAAARARFDAAWGPPDPERVSAMAALITKFRLRRARDLARKVCPANDAGTGQTDREAAHERQSS